MNKIIIVVFLSITTFYLSTDKSDSYYFDVAYSKIKQFNPRNKDYVVIIDFRKNVFSERLYLLDLQNKKIILDCRVSHAWSSGFFYPNEISNVPGSEKSSVGGFLTLNSRQGRYGYSMVIRGLEKGKNDNVENRVIIFHPTRIPWSKGCFATSRKNNEIIINHMKNGRLIYVIN